MCMKEKSVLHRSDGKHNFTILKLRRHTVITAVALGLVFTNPLLHTDGRDPQLLKDDFLLEAVVYSAEVLND